MNDQPDDLKALLESIKLQAKQCAELRLRAESLLKVVQQWSSDKTSGV